MESFIQTRNTVQSVVERVGTLDKFIICVYGMDDNKCIMDVSHGMMSIHHYAEKHYTMYNYHDVDNLLTKFYDTVQNMNVSKIYIKIKNIDESIVSIMQSITKDIGCEFESIIK
jgi:hypothetical protein